MAFVDTDAIDFYEPTPPKAGLPGDKRLPASKRNVPTIGQQREGRQASGTSNRPSSGHQDYDPIEIQDMTTPSPNESLDSLGKLGPEVEAAGVDAGDMANEPCVIRRRDRIGSDASQDLPSLEELLFSAIDMQEPQRAGGSGAHFTRRSDKRLGHAVENNPKENDHPKSGWGECKGGYISSMMTLEICDIQDAERRLAAAVASAQATARLLRRSRSSTLHRKNEFSTPHATTPQIHESIDEGRHGIENDPSTSGDKRAQCDDKRGKQTMEGGGLQGDNNEKSALLRPTKKRWRSAAGTKLPFECRVKRRRFLSPVSSDEETETEPESNTSSYAPKPCRTSNFPPSSSLPLSKGCERESSPDDALEAASGRLKRRPLSRTAVIYEQQLGRRDLARKRYEARAREAPEAYLI